MLPVSDALLLEVAGISASLLGFFVVGVFFYVQRGMFPGAADQAQRYLQTATRTVIVLYGMVLFLSLGLVALETPRVRLMYAVVSVLLAWSVFRTGVAIRTLHAVLDVRVMSPIGMWLAAAAIVGAPWLGGTEPTRENLTGAIALIGVFAFVSSASLVLSAFEISRLEADAARTRTERSPRGVDESRISELEEEGEVREF
jgi:hypothetical protein